MKKCGFTLVELSIVLVIIGLLIGGILVGQSLIKSARINAQVKQFAQYDVAASSFKQKFRNIPGDSSAFPLNGGPGGYLGNNDKLLDTQSPVPSSIVLYNYNEAANFFPHLSASQMLNDGKNYVAWEATCGNFRCSKLHVPVAALDDKLGVAAYGINATNKNYYELFVSHTNSNTAGSNISYTWPDSASIADSMALDSKIDDGNPIAGTVTMRKSGVADILNLAYDTSSPCLDASNKYNPPTSDTYSCTPRIEMFANTGGRI